MVGVLRKIITEATGAKVESEMPPLLEFFTPADLKVIMAGSAASSRGQVKWVGSAAPSLPSTAPSSCCGHRFLLDSDSRTEERLG